VLQPNEVGKVEILLDGRRFIGPKTCSLYLTLNNGTARETRVFTIKADNSEPQDPAGQK
jgi:hypothetical protein